MRITIRPRDKACNSVIDRCSPQRLHFSSSQLSRPAYTVADQMNVLDSLHQLTHNRNLVFGPGNYEQEFIGCLSHCLLQLSEDIESSQNKKRTTWHVETPTAISVTAGTDALVEGAMTAQVGFWLI